MEYTSELQKQGADLHSTLTYKAWESEAFKAQLINDPKAIIEEITGKDLSTFNKKIEVVDQTDQDVIYINIPPRVDVDDLQLTEEQLEQLSGGIIPVVYVVGAAIGYGVCAVIDHYN